MAKNGARRGAGRAGLDRERARRAVESPKPGKPRFGKPELGAEVHEIVGGSVAYYRLATDIVEVDGKAHDCPVADVHTRMEDVHALWHEAADAYDDPTAFRRKLNSLLQELRNVTFVLQGQKRSLESVMKFDDWYSSWQLRMRRDKRLRWVVDARNKVTKQGRLDVHSWADVNLVGGYGKPLLTLTNSRSRAEMKHETPHVLVPLGPSSTLSSYLSFLPDGIPDGLIRHAYLERSRYWADEELPECEVLDTCAHAFGTYLQMLDDLHRQIGRNSGLFVDAPGGLGLVPQGVGDGRYPCMDASLEARTQKLGLIDGRDDIGGTRHTVRDVTLDQVMASIERYGLSGLPVVVNGDLLGALDEYMHVARRMLQEDRSHGWVVFLFSRGRFVSVELLTVRDQADKFAAMRNLAQTVKLSGVDGVMQIGDMWTAVRSADKSVAMLRASEREDRSESLVVSAEMADGRRRSLYSPYSRKEDGSVVFDSDAPVVVDENYDQTLEPIRRVWRDRLLSRFRPLNGI